MELSAGLKLFPDTPPYTGTTLINAPLFINGIWQTEESGSTSAMQNYAYGADMGSSKRVVRIELAGVLKVGTVNTETSGPMYVHILVSDDNAYWTSKGMYTADYVTPSSTTIICGVTIDDEVNATGRYVKAVIDDTQYYFRGSGGDWGTYAKPNFQEIYVFGFEGEGFADVPLPEAADNFFLASGSCDIVLPDCVDFEGAGVCDLPEIDAVGYATIRYTSEPDIALPDAVNGSVSAIGNCDIFLPDADGRAFVGYLEAFGECDIILPEAFSEAVEAIGELFLPDAFGEAVIGKYVFGECEIVLPFGVGVAVKGQYAYGECDIFLPDIVTINALFIASGSCDLVLPDCEKALSALISPDPDTVRLEYWNVY